MQHLGRERLDDKAAQLALERLANEVVCASKKRAIGLLFLHGPPGAGKTHAASALVDTVIARAPDRSAIAIPAYDLASCLWPSAEESASELQAVRDCDLLLVEDVQHLPPRYAEALVQLLDRRLARKRPTMITATGGPSSLAQFSSRLSSRLAAGLVVELPARSLAERKRFLESRAATLRLKVKPDVLSWLAEQLPGSGRALEGALTQLAISTRERGRPLEMAEAAACVGARLEGTRPTLERIAQLVGKHYRVEPEQLRSRRRQPGIVGPRHVSMYLARQLTSLPLRQIGAYFGVRDHGSVLHACRKIERALIGDALLQEIVHQVRAELT